MSTTIAAHAKLTLTLRITGVRADGYHLIDAEMVSLDLADRLTIDTAWREDDGSELTASGPFSDGVPLDHTNLVAKALRLCNRDACVHIEKNIPHGGGLGGGSADAAAVLRWAGFTDSIDAATLGADVPFCLVGGRARVQGVGELVTPLTFVAREFTLIIPPLQCPTPLVYRAWDDLGGPRSDGPNDLEPAAVHVQPRLIWWRDRIAETAGALPHLAGSGSTWFVEGHRAELIEALPDARVVLAATVD
jgi:4-diphosphocytidyl-2-C-methyl-D-erythritol kinase